MQSLLSIPGSRYITGSIPSSAAAAATAVIGDPIPVFDNCRLTAIRIIPAAGLTGADTESANFNFINKGTTGAGTTELTHIDFEDGTDLTAYEATVLTLATPVNLAAGSVIVVQRELVTADEQNAVGLATPACTIQLVVDGAYAGL